MISKPHQTELTDYYKSYINLVYIDELIEAYEIEGLKTIQLFETIQPEMEDFRYKENKWSIKELLQHIIDSERIFCYRALRISRKDNTELAGYDDNIYIENSNCKHRKLIDLIEEFKIIRKATQLLFKSMDIETIDFMGKANGNLISARIIGWMIVGHSIHHCNILKSRYLK